MISEGKESKKSENGAVNGNKNEALLQVNPQLHKWLSIVNSNTSTTIMPQENNVVNSTAKENNTKRV